MIQVTLTFEDQNALVAFFTRGAAPVAAQAETAKAIEKAAKVVAPKPVQAEKPAPTPPVIETAILPPATECASTELAPVSPSEPALTLESVRAKLASLSQGGKQAQVKDLISSMGAAKLTDLKVEQYADLMTKADAL